MPVRKVIIKAAKKSDTPPFPYYDSLVTKIKEANITEPNAKVWSQISKFNEHNARIIYLLILHYARLHQHDEDPPFTPKIQEGGRGLIYTVGNLPHELKIILSVCVEEITNN
jgi:hypothetical protein